MQVTLQKNLTQDPSYTENPFIGTNDFFDYAKSKEPDYFHQEFKITMLNSDSGMIELHHYSSDLELEKVLNYLPVEDIQTVEVCLQNQGEHKNVSFFDLDLHFSEGTLRLCTNWCLWKESRTQELVYGMLIPLCLAGLQSVTICRFAGGMLLCQPATAVKTLVNAAKVDIPKQFDYQDGPCCEDTMQFFIKAIKVALELQNEPVSDAPEYIKDRPILDKRFWKLQQILA